MKCARVDCNNEIKTGKTYCSNSCAAIARHAAKRAMTVSTPSIVPNGVQTALERAVGRESVGELIAEVQRTMLEDGMEKITPPTIGITEKDIDYNSVMLGSGDKRPYGDLSFEVIREMRKSGAIVFVVEMKKAWQLSVFRSPTSVTVRCPDEELRKVVQANIADVLPLMANDFLDSSLYYGASFQELVWKYATTYELGITKSRMASKQYVVMDVPNSVNPETVESIRRTMYGDFDGFVQKSKVNPNKRIEVDLQRAFVLTHQKRFGNLWGTSMLAPMYPIWYWYEYVLRSMVRYMERMATPVAVCYAPSRAMVTQPGTTDKVAGLKWGLMIAGAAAKSNAIAVPSDTHPETNQPLWRLEYLTAQDRGAMFNQALEFLFQAIVRAGITADRTTTQESGGVGSYAIGNIHNQATQMHNEMLLTGTVAQLDRYVFPKYSLYNRGIGGPPVRVETIGLNSEEKQRFAELIKMGGSMQDSEVATRVNWDMLLKLQNIPTLSDAEMEAKEKRNLEKTLTAQKAMAKIAPKPTAPEATQPKPQQDDSDEDDTESKKKEELERFVENVASGKERMVVLSDSEARRISGR